MRLCNIRIGKRKLIFSHQESISVPDYAFGIIYPSENGLVITDACGKARLMIIKDHDGVFCWFVSGRKQGRRFRTMHTTNEDEKEYGLDKLSYSECIALATAIYRKCQQFIREKKR